MSNKDILDRLASTPAKLPKPSEVKGTDARANDTRVGSTVVRRRPSGGAAEPPPPPPAPVVAPRTIRRPGPRPEDIVPVRTPQVVARPVAAPEPVVSVEVEPTGAPEAEAPVVAPEVGEPRVEAARGDGVLGDAAPGDAAPGDAAREDAASGVGPEPEVHVERPARVEPPPILPDASAEPTLERAVIIDRPGGSARMPQSALTGRGPMALNRMPDSPILPGLGRAVVSLPAGYDPTDPTGARRRARENASQAPRWGPGAGDRNARPPVGARAEPGAPAAPGDDRRPKKGRRSERSEHVMSGMGNDARHRRPKKGNKEGRPTVPQKAVKRKVRVEGEMSVANLAHEMGMKAGDVIKFLMNMGQQATVNQSIDFDTATLIAQEFGHEVVNVAFDEATHLIQGTIEGESELPVRPPVVTVMGHVDHGKTTLLDTIRKAKVAAGEAGGITQHIGAYQVRKGDRPITFIDTPGHAAFSAMRARGAKATDIVILVVAADDGVMPQTIEAIAHAKAAKVPILVAINKMDKPGIQLERIKQGLMEHGLVPEEFGGDTIMVPVSALKGTGVDDLLDNVLLVAEVADLRANPDRHGEGLVLESRLEVGRGAVATLLVQTGTLKQGDTVVIGNTWGRVRAMSDDRGGKVKEAGPSAAVEIMGLQDIPGAGDDFVVVGSEKDARALVEHRQENTRVGAISQRQKLTVDDLYKTGGSAFPIQHVVLKCDVSGSLEALKSALEALVVGGTSLKILHAAIGPVNESDVNLAAGSQALIVAFGVKADAKARQAADSFGLEIERYEVIYNVLDDVKARMEGMLAPVYEEQKLGEAEVRAVFKIPKLGVIAGCMVTDGKVQRGLQAKVLREGAEVFEGKVTSLKRFKEDVKEVEKGFECGIGVEGVEPVVGDVIVIMQRVQVARTSS